MGTKWPNWVRNDQIENKSGYEMTKMVRNDFGTKWPWYEMTGYHTNGSKFSKIMSNYKYLQEGVMHE